MCPLVAASLAIAAAASPSPVFIRIDGPYTSRNPGSDVVLLKDSPHRFAGTAYGTGAVDVWLDHKLVGQAPVVGKQGNMSDWPTWEITLPPMPASFGHKVQVTANSTTGYNATTGIGFGTVLLCSGQSNMALNVGPVHFDADNGTAESLASSRYTGKISLLRSAEPPATMTWTNVSNATLPEFSAVCWYTGKAYYDTYMVPEEPLGLLLGPVSGTPIEYWVRNQADIASCGNVTGRCWNASRVPDGRGNPLGLSHLYNDLIKPLVTAGLGISAIIWDQAEADVGCHVDDFPTPLLGGDPTYSCLEKAMIAGWRADFAPLSGNRTAVIPWIGVQLPGYGKNTTGLLSNKVFDMRLGQAAGIEGVEAAEVVPTYDLSCPNCPWGSIHPTHKQTVGERIAPRLAAYTHGWPKGQGPKAVRATATAWKNATLVTIVFDGFDRDQTGEPAVLELTPTRNCTFCCDTGHSDFDISVDGGKRWVAGNSPGKVSGRSLAVEFDVAPPAVSEAKAASMIVRYTATQTFPQCAATGPLKLPAFPFQQLADVANWTHNGAVSRA